MKEVVVFWIFKSIFFLGDQVIPFYVIPLQNVLLGTVSSLDRRGMVLQTDARDRAVRSRILESPEVGSSRVKNAQHS